jgi:hypothetical protein
MSIVQLYQNLRRGIRSLEKGRRRVIDTERRQIVFALLPPFLLLIVDIGSKYISMSNEDLLGDIITISLLKIFSNCMMMQRRR